MCPAGYYISEEFHRLVDPTSLAAPAHTPSMSTLNGAARSSSGIALITFGRVFVFSLTAKKLAWAICAAHVSWTRAPKGASTFCGTVVIARVMMCRVRQMG